MICHKLIVRESCGAYVTSTVLGQRASSTMSAEAAVQRLADKLAAAGDLREPAVHLDPCGLQAAPGVSRWLIEEGDADPS